ncbi:MAG: hypothetical protein HQ513_14485 [Rhodospirillales bacterium]|nr:hypothetical protein [Rhodospirillales bacterium]
MSTKTLASTIDVLALILATTVAVTVALTVFSGSAGAGEKDRRNLSQNILEQRLRDHCKTLVGEWLRSDGMSNPAVQARAADCFLAHARISIGGGRNWGLDLSSTTVSEVPAAILQARTGINLGDWYSRLAGRAFTPPPAGIGRILKQPTITTGGVK